MASKWIVALASVMVSGCGGSGGSAETNAQLKEIKMQRMAREFVSANLKDPGSAEFRNQREFCGEVNARNSLGGFTGFKRFIAGNENLVILEDDSRITAAEFQAMWSEHCR